MSAIVESDEMIAHKKVLAEMSPAQKRAVAREIMITAFGIGDDHTESLASLTSLERSGSEGCLASLDHYHREVFANQGFAG